MPLQSRGFMSRLLRKLQYWGESGRGAFVTTNIRRATLRAVANMQICADGDNASTLPLRGPALRVRL